MSERLQTQSGWDRRRVMVSERLETLALQLFARHGYSNISVEEIAAAAGISSRTFNRYFPSKQDVLLQPGERMDRRVTEEIGRLHNIQSPVRQIRDIYIDLTRHAMDLAPFRLWARALGTAPDVEARLREESRRRLTKAMRPVFAEWLGVDPKVDVRPEAMSAAVLGVASVAVDRYLRSAGKADLVQLFLEAFDFLERGLGRYKQARSSVSAEPAMKPQGRVLAAKPEGGSSLSRSRSRRVQDELPREL